MFMEYDWTFDCYRFRFGDSFTDVLGWRYAETKEDAKAMLASAKLKLGRKTDTRTWKIEAIG